MNKTCGCYGEATRVCVLCGRRICAWHLALQPTIFDGQIVTQQVCAPSCGYHAGASAQKVKEWRPAA